MQITSYISSFMSLQVLDSHTTIGTFLCAGINMVNLPVPQVVQK